MPAQLATYDESLARPDRKRELVLLCASDRAAWADACLPVNQPPPSLVSTILYEASGLVGAMLPGRIGRWVRGASFIAGLVRNLGRNGR